MVFGMVAKCEYIYKQQQKQKKRKQMKGSYEVLVLELSVPAGPTSFPSCCNITKVVCLSDWCNMVT